MIRGLVFDFDGTLADTLPGILDGWNETFAVLGIGRPDPVVVKKAIGPTKDVYLRMVLGPYFEKHGEEALKVFKRAYLETHIKKTVFFPGIGGLLKTLKRVGVKTAIASNKPYGQIMLLVDLMNLADLFDPILGPEKVREGKPAPDMFLECARVFGFPPSEVAVLGDTPLDLIAGKNAGMTRIAALWGYSGPDELRAHSPDFLAATPSDVSEYLGLEVMGA